MEKKTENGKFVLAVSVSADVTEERIRQINAAVNRVLQWFEKYTELEVILKDKDGTILQAQTIAIQHDDGYTLTIIKSETHTQ